jgi:hypothetical protein
VNLHSLAVGVISVVNPLVPITIQFSTGWTTAADGTRTPIYSAPVPMQAQIQALTFGDLRQLEGLNLQGTQRAAYLWGDTQGIVRISSLGGDLITVIPAFGRFPPNSIWLTTLALETWANDNWCKVSITLQDGQ